MKKIVRQAKSFVPTRRARDDFQPYPDYSAVPDDADYDDMRFSGEPLGGEDRGSAGCMVTREL